MWPTPKIAFLLLSAHSLLVSGSPVDSVQNETLGKRQSCPAIHVFGARETTVSPGYGSSGTVVNLILSAFPGSTSEAITYPACGGQSSCGGIAYGNSASQGTTSAANAVNSLNQRCPSTQIVLVGYSQGGQIMDNAVCGGPDTGSGITSTAPPISSAALNMVKAVILMGSPRYVKGLSYNVGTCAAQGVRRPPILPLTADHVTHTNNATVRRPPIRVHMRFRRQDPELLRLSRPVLLHRQRPGGAPRLRHQVRAASARLRQDEAQCFWRRHPGDEPHNYYCGEHPCGYPDGWKHQLRGLVGAVWRAGMERGDVLLAGDLQGVESVVFAVLELVFMWK